MGHSLVDKKLIKRKLGELRRYSSELKKHQKKSLKSIEDDLALAWSIQHGLQLSIQIILDVCNHILAARGINEIENYSDVLKKCGQNGILPRAFAERIKSMAGFRNILVHEYADVDLKIVHSVLNNYLKDFEMFSTLIHSYLRKRK
jgi:uncharacterized protein YutE (UPF0331/DUF86 family)